MEDPIHIALAADHRYLPGLLVTAASIMRSASEKRRLHFHIFSAGLTEEDKNRICSLMSEYDVPHPAFLNPDMAAIAAKFKAYKGSHAAFIRLFLTDYISADWVLYSDADTLWLRDVSELWNLRDDAASILWCKDLPSISRGVHAYAQKWDPEFDEAKYCCSGVTLMNLKRLRETNLNKHCIEFVQKWGTPFFVDQDILNYICRDTAKILPQHWDCLVPTREAVNGLVYHFTGIGSMFNAKFSGWRPLYYPWFRFYYDHILKEPQRTVCPLVKRLFFWVLGTIYPSDCFVALFVSQDTHLFDNIRRQVFFAWLWRHAKWRKGSLWRTPSSSSST